MDSTPQTPKIISIIGTPFK